MMQNQTTTRVDNWLKLKLVQVTWLALGLLEALLGLRFVLKLVAANRDNMFASFVYNISRPFMLPFADLTFTPQAEGIVLEINTLIAMAVYALAAWAVLRVIFLIFSQPRQPAAVASRREVTAVRMGDTPTPHNRPQ
jgi:YggT family protein